MTRAPTADGQKTRLLQPSPPSPPPGLCVPMLGGSGLYRGGGYWPPWGNGGNCQNFISRLEAEPTSRPSVQAPGRLEGQPVRVEWTLHGRTHRGSLSGDAVSHGYGLATASGERAWLCPQLPPLPKWLLPPPARGHPVSSRGRIERHGAYKQPRMVGAAGNCAGSRYAARRANLRCNNSVGAVALTAWLGDRQCQRQWRWRFSGLGQGAIGRSG